MLDLYKLEIFAIVVQAGSFSAAADRLLMSQPAVSQHIQDLEGALGTRLFDRGRRGVRLTQAGATLHDYTRAIFELVAEAENAVVDVKKLAGGQVTVGATPGVSVYLLPDWVQAFTTAYPNLTVSVQTSITPDIVRDLVTGRMDLGFVEGELGEVTDDRLGIAPLETFDQLVIVGPRHPWWARAEVSLPDLNEQPFVMRQRNSQTRIWLDGMMQEHHIRLRVAAEFDNVESIKRAVVNGAGITILPEYVVRGEVEAGKLRALPIAGDPLRRTLKLLWNRGTYRSPVVRSFVRFLRRYVPALETVQM